MKNIGKRYRRPHSLIGVSISIVFLCFFMLSFASAEKIIQTSSTGLTIEYPKFDDVEVGEQFEFNIHVFNSTNGLPVTNESVDCFLHGYYRNGTHALMVELGFYPPFDFNYTIQKEVFTGGKGAYIVQCNNSEGGFVSANFDVTPTGFELEISEALLYFIIIFFIFLFFITSIIFAIKTPFGNEKIIKDDGTILVKKVTLWKYIKLFLISLSYGMFMWLITIITSITVNYIHYDKLVTISKSLYLMVMAIGWTGGLVMAILVFILIWRDIIFNQDIIKFGESVISGDVK